MNWKHLNPPYGDNPQKMTDLISSVFATHRPTWADVQTLLHMLLTADE